MMKFVNTLLLLLTIIGGFNWFLLEVFGFDLVRVVIAPYMLEKAAYVIIGLSSLYSLSLLKKVYKSS